MPPEFAAVAVPPNLPQHLARTRGPCPKSLVRRRIRGGGWVLKPNPPDQGPPAGSNHGQDDNEARARAPAGAFSKAGAAGAAGPRRGQSTAGGAAQRPCGSRWPRWMGGVWPRAARAGRARARRLVDAGRRGCVAPRSPSPVPERRGPRDDLFRGSPLTFGSAGPPAPPARTTTNASPEVVVRVAVSPPPPPDGD